nr:hypothetical protein P9270_025390 [Mesorhizobium sp. WSM4875]
MLLHKHISMARRRVREGERHIARQHERIARLRSERLPTTDALRFLDLLLEVHALWREHLSRLLSVSTGSQRGSELSAETLVTEGSNAAISIPDSMVRLGPTLEKELREILGWYATNPGKGKLH